MTDWNWNLQLRANKYKAGSITILNENLGSYSANGTATLQFQVGFTLEFQRFRLSKIAFRMSLSSYMEIKSKVTLGEVNKGPSITNPFVPKKLWNKQLLGEPFMIYIGEIPIVVSPGVNIAFIVKRPALGVTIESFFNTSGQLGFETGWDNQRGPYLIWDNKSPLEPYFDFKPITYPGNGHSLQGSIEFNVQPFFSLGVAGTAFSFLKVGIPMGIPVISTGVDWNGQDTNGDTCIKFYANIKFVLKASIEFTTITLAKFIRIKGPQWKPTKPLQSHTFGSWTLYQTCVDVDDVIEAAEEVKYRKYHFFVAIVISECVKEG